MRKRTLINFLILFFYTQNVFALSVVRVVDGDTIVLSNKKKVRMIGVDTPEIHDSQKLKKDIEETKESKEQIQAMGLKAKIFTTSLLLKKTVKLKYEKKKTDRYGRTLAYVYLSDGSLVNEEIVRQGYGCAYTKFKFEMKNDFLKAESQARREKLGLWPEINCK